MNHATVSHHLALNLLSADGHDLLLVAELRYSAQDPLAVEALFDDGSPDPVRWVFARDLLAAGLHRRTGGGDVVVWPTQDAEARPAVHLRLRSPHGDALLEAPADALEEFLAATARVVAPGTEYDHLDVDGALESLLGES
ncbi:MAG: SsgA family sporulation/cell division regulator [Jiangellaceae bacterium]